MTIPNAASVETCVLHRCVSHCGLEVRREETELRSIPLRLTSLTGGEHVHSLCVALHHTINETSKWFTPLFDL